MKRKTKKPTNLTAFYDEIITPVDEGRAVTVAYLAFSKAVDMFPQHPCIQDQNITVGGLARWVKNCLAHRLKGQPLLV